MLKLSQELFSKLQFIAVWYISIGLFLVIYQREDITDKFNIFDITLVSSLGIHQVGIFDAFVILLLPTLVLYLLYKLGFKPTMNARTYIAFPHWYEYVLFYGLAALPIIYIFYQAYRVLMSM